MRGSAQTSALAVVSTATFNRDAVLAPDMIVTAFSTAIPEVGPATATPLPTSLGGYSFGVRAAAGSSEINAGIIAINAGQASFVPPAGLPDGAASITLRRSSDVVATGSVRIARVAPGSSRRTLRAKARRPVLLCTAVLGSRINGPACRICRCRYTE